MRIFNRKYYLSKSFGVGILRQMYANFFILSGLICPNTVESSSKYPSKVNGAGLANIVMEILDGLCVPVNLIKDSLLMSPSQRNPRPTICPFISEQTNFECMPKFSPCQKPEKVGFLTGDVISEDCSQEMSKKQTPINRIKVFITSFLTLIPFEIGGNRVEFSLLSGATLSTEQLNLKNIY